MKPFAVLSQALLLLLSLLTPPERLKSCLPPDIKLTDVVSAEIIKSEDSGNVVKKVTVKEKLAGLKAHCKRGKLVDGRGREIHFYKLSGCWGNPPAHYRKILERQREDLDNLKKRHTVIEMTCNPSGLLIQ